MTISRTAVTSRAAWLAGVSMLALVAVTGAVRAQSVVASGDVTPSPVVSGSTWTNFFDLNVGYNGTGTLTVKDGGVVINEVGYIGVLSASENNSVTVTGRNATWTNRDNLQIGFEGKGTLTVTDRGTVTNNIGVIGGEKNSVGTATVEAVGSRWTSRAELYVGNQGNGTLTVSNGGVVAAGGTDGKGLAIIAAEAGSTGTVNIGARIDEAAATAGTLNAAEIRLGAGTGALNFNHTDTNYTFAPIMTGSTTGSVNHLAGTTIFETANSYMGTTNITGGTLRVRNGSALGAADVGTFVGTGATLELEGNVEVKELLNITGSGVTDGGALRNRSGNNRYTGSITLTGNARINSDADTLTLGGGIIVQDGVGGDLTLGGAGNGLVAGPIGLTIGGLTKDGSGTWTLNGQNTMKSEIVVNGGRLELTDGGTVKNTIGRLGTSSSSGTVFVTGPNSTWTNSSDLYIGDSGTAFLRVMSGGRVKSAGATLGNAPGASGKMALIGRSSTWENSGDLDVGFSGNGELAVADGGVLNNVHGWIGKEQGSTGVTTVTGPNAIWNNTGNLYVGNAGNGALTIAAGGTVVNDYAFIGQASGSTGTVTVGRDSLWQNQGTLYVGNEGIGMLAVSEGGRVKSNMGTIGYKSKLNSRATVTGENSSWISNGDLEVGYAGNGTLVVEKHGTVRNKSGGYIGRNDGSIGAVTVSDEGSNWTNGGNLDVGAAGTGKLTVKTGGNVISANGYVGNAATSAGTVTVTGPDSTWMNNENLIVGWKGKGTLTVAAGGTVATGGTNGTGKVTIASEDASVGTVNIGGAANETATAAGKLLAKDVQFGAGTGALTFNHTELDYAFAPVISGKGQIDVRSGTTRLTGINSGFTGTTSVDGGGLLVDGTLGDATSTLSVVNEGQLGGIGTVGGAVAVSDGRLAGTHGQTLTMASLALSEKSVVDVGLVTASTTPLFLITGDLTLDGTLNASNESLSFGNFNSGIYRLFDYGGMLTDNGLAIGTTPAGIASGDLSVQTAIAGQVNLLVTTGRALSFWDGGNSAVYDNDIIDGGNGTWQVDTRSWTNANGTMNGRYSPNPTFAVFQGAAGTVVVDGSTGAISVTGLQIATDGYGIQGGAITLEGADGQSMIRVGDGSSAGADITATIAAPLTGTSALVVSDLGTLILTGTNTYSGGTILQSGTLSVSEDANLGAATGGLIFDGGTLATRADFETARAAEFDNGTGRFSVASNTTLGLTGVISGAGGPDLSGGGTLTLSGANTYTGKTQVRSSTLIGNAGSIKGDIANTGTVVFSQETNAAFAGNIVGIDGKSGTMIKRGTGSLTLEGTSALDWSIEGGRLVSTADRFTGSLDIASGAGFTFGGKTGIYISKLTGAGDLDISGSGSVTFDGDGSAFTGTTTVADGTLSGAGTIGGKVTLSKGTIAGTMDKTLTMGSLILSDSSIVNVTLGAASAKAMFSVKGDLTLDGTLNVADAGGFGTGLYRLFDYGGTLSDKGLEIGSAPDGVDLKNLSVQTAELTKQVNLIYATPVVVPPVVTPPVITPPVVTPPIIVPPVRADIGFWTGGSGTWRADGRDWTNADGSVTGALTPEFAVFQQAPATVTVDTSAGSISVTGLQFATDGTRIDGDAITLAGQNSESVIRVGDGTAAGAATTATIASELTGDSALVVSDLGTLTLTGTNTYSGGTQVRSGTLIGDTGSIKGTITNASTVVLNQSRDAVLADDIQSLDGKSGRMIKRGVGSLLLSGTSALNWSVEDGRVSSATDRFTGDLALARGAGFTFDQAYSGSYAGALTGAGDIVFAGGGAMRLTGDNADYTGTSTVSGATLSVDKRLGGSTLVTKGGRLGGNGTLGSGAGSTVTLAEGGTLAPGNSIGALTVNGDLVVSPGSRYEVEVAPGSSDSDRVTVTGTAKLNGGMVSHIGMTGSYDPTASYTILSASGGVSGRFDGVASDFAFLTSSLGYGTHDVQLTLMRNDIGFADVAHTRNQRATAASIGALGVGSELYDAILPLDAATARTSFDMLSGEIHASSLAVLMDDSRHLRTLANDRLRAAFDETDDTGVSAWASTYGSWGRTQGRSGAENDTAEVARATGGLIMGGDGAVSDQARIGVLAGYGRTGIDLAARTSSADIDSTHIGLYGGTQWDAPQGTFSLRAGVAYSHHRIESRRSPASDGFAAQDLSAHYDSDSLQAFGELGYALQTGLGRIEPFVGLAHVNLDGDGFAESGGAAALTSTGGSNGITMTTLGVRSQTVIDLGQLHGRLNAMIGWRNASGAATPVSMHAFAGSPVFAITGSPVATNAIVLDTGINLDLTPDTNIALSYQGQFASKTHDQSVKANLTSRF